MSRLTRKSLNSDMVWFVDHDNNMELEPCEMSPIHNRLVLQKLAEYEDGLNKCKDFADEIYKFFCNRENWYAFKDQWLENGECHWLKLKIDSILKEFENSNK